MDYAEDVEPIVELVSHPEISVSFLPDLWMCKNEDNADDGEQNDSRETSYCSKYPERKCGLRVGVEVEFASQTSQVFDGLCRDVIKVNAVTDGMHH